MSDGTPSAGSPTPLPGSSPTLPSTANPSQRPRPTAVWVVVIAVAASLVLAAVFLVGPFGGSSGNSSGGSGATFSGARALADQFAASHGSWELVEGIGLALFNGTYYPFNGTVGNASCTVTTLAGAVPTNLSLPAYRGNLTNGGAPVWLFAFIQPATSSELAMIEVGGAVALAFEITGSCLDGALSELLTIPSTVVDSSQAAAAAAAAGGYDFLRAHPDGVSLTMFLFGGFSTFNTSREPTWEVEWSTCASPFAPGSSSGPSSGYQFMAAVNATTGALLPGSAWNSTCGTSPPPTGIGGALTFGASSLIVGAGSGGTVASQGCTSGDYCYSVPIVASTNVTPADFTTSVTNFSNGATYLGTVGFAILTVGGSVLVSYTGAVETQWTAGTGTSDSLLSAGMMLIVDMGPQNPSAGNWGLTLVGQGPYANSSMGFSL